MLKLITETAGNMPCKGHQEDGDSLLWAGLLKASGMELDDAILDANLDGQFFRSPLRADKAKSGISELNSFSRDMATGLTLAASSDTIPLRILTAYESWIDFVTRNGCKACKDTDGRCIMTPAIFWMASYAGAHNVPLGYEVTRWLLKPYLLLTSSINPKGFQLHLVGVSIFTMVFHYGSRKRLPLLLRLAAKMLHKRQPKNPFFAWLACKDAEAETILLKIKKHIARNGQGRRHQWAWERDDAEEAWKDSCGWDITFIDNLLKLKL